MDFELDALEARVIGALLEKAVTTPDQYPLSLNALLLACNQKTAREPVLELAEGEVQATVDGLIRKHLVIERSGFGSRVPKYAQRFCNTEFGTLKFDPQELGLLCVLLLRGAQTAGELRTRTARLCRFADVDEAEAVLQRLARRDDGPFVVLLPREPGKREARYMHLFCGPVDSAQELPPAAVSGVSAGPGGDRLGRLEQELAALREEVAELRQLLDELTR
ncbi:MAG TPA: DUF480 domain-containing protein [Gammaproteobacteria bacterium]